MKLIKAIVILSLTINSLFGQSYENLFGSKSTQWEMTIGNLWRTGTTEHQITSDTLINGLTNKIITGFESFDAMNGFIRQDATSEKAWYRNTISLEEYLIMDLSLEVGDSMFIGGVWNADHRFYMVDSIYQMDNRKHVRFDFPIGFMENEKFTLIEGVVSNMGFRYQDNDFIDGFPTILLCTFKNTEKVYGEEDCIFTSVEENEVTSELKLYPNPVTDELTLRLDQAIPE